ncbi:hypothetical protein V8C86DRAFT_2994662 [Haematococcus lacustris]
MNTVEVSCIHCYSCFKGIMFTSQPNIQTDSRRPSQASVMGLQWKSASNFAHEPCGIGLPGSTDVAEHKMGASSSRGKLQQSIDEPSWLAQFVACEALDLTLDYSRGDWAAQQHLQPYMLPCLPSAPCKVAHSYPTPPPSSHTVQPLIMNCEDSFQARPSIAAALARSTSARSDGDACDHERAMESCLVLHAAAARPSLSASSTPCPTLPNALHRISYDSHASILPHKQMGAGSKDIRLVLAK